jgi:hypothetical protein
MLYADCEGVLKLDNHQDILSRAFTTCFYSRGWTKTIDERISSGGALVTEILKLYVKLLMIEL